MLGRQFSISTIKKSNPHQNATGGMAVPRLMFLILLVGKSHNHIRDCKMRKKAMPDDSVR